MQHARTLEIDGCFYGRIESVQPRFDPYSFRGKGEMWAAVNKLRSVVSATETISSSIHAEMESWYALLMDQYPEADDSYPKRLSKNFGARKTFAADLEVAMRSELPTRLFQELKTKLNNKVLCTTSTGHVALVLGEAQVGDRVFVARGATNPFVLRPAVADKTYDEVKEANGVSTLYRFVGGSCVHGIMDGEVLEMIGKAAKDVKEETVLLV